MKRWVENDQEAIEHPIESARKWDTFEDCWNWAYHNRGWLVDDGGWFRVESIKVGIVPDKYVLFSTTKGYIG